MPVQDDADSTPQVRLPPVQMNLHAPKSPATAMLHHSEICTARSKAGGITRHLAFDVSDTKLAGQIRPGQSFGVIPPGTDEQGKAHKVRLFSLASPTGGEDGSGRIIATTVKRVIDEQWEDHSLFLGVCSNYLCDLQPGSEVSVTGPVGRRFLLPEDPHEHNYVFFSTGTGIAPFRGMMKELLGEGVERPKVLVAGAPYSSDLFYHQLFEQYAAEHAHVRYWPAVSRHPQEDGTPPMYVHGRIPHNRDELRPLLRDERTLIYICGITGMETGIFQALAQVLDPKTLEGYLKIDDEAPSDPAQWDRKMIGRSIKPTARVMMEVYD
jgi:ferredoxin--NADP+ reductase